MGKHQNNRISDFKINPGEEKLILVCQEGALNYKLNGGEGTCSFDLLDIFKTRGKIK